MGTKTAVIFYLFLFSSYLLAQKYDLTLAEEYSLGNFQRATRVVVSMQGTIYITDADQNKIIVYKNINDTPDNFGGFGWSTGSFDRPTGIATDGVNLYVSDYGNHRIQRFDGKLNYISSLYTRDTSDAYSRFGYPIDVALSEQGDLFVIDGENLRVLKFNTLYYYERSFGNINTSEGKLQNPVKMIIASSKVFIGEHNRIVIFDYYGNYLGSIGDGYISDMNGFAVTDDNIIAASGDTLVWFSKEGKIQKAISKNQIFFNEKITQIQDVASYRDKLFVLTTQKLYILRIIK